MLKNRKSNGPTVTACPQRRVGREHAVIMMEFSIVWVAGGSGGYPSTL
jgi:hypothetical protein